VAYIGFNPRTSKPTLWLEGEGLCQAALFGEEPPAAPPQAQAAAPAEPSAPPADPSRAMDPELKNKIKKMSDTNFEIDRSAVDKILENQADLMKSARIVPEQKDGKVVGLRLFGVRPETLLGQLGLTNGDRLESINGFDMGSPEKALEAYARLRTAESLTVNVNRRGTPTTIEYKIK
jgi:general secretion pathway protein C